MLVRMNGVTRWLAGVGTVCVLAGCSTVVVQPTTGTHRPALVSRARSPQHGTYRVVRGDTLYSIAFRNGLDFRDLARWNGIGKPYTIWPGQVLQLSPGHHASAAGHASGQHVAASAASRRVASTGFEPVKAAPSGTASGVVPKEPVVPAHAVSTSVPVAGEPAHAVPPPAPPVSVASTGGSRSVGGVVWHWPTTGSVIKGFQASDAIPGIEIAGKAGDPVRAAADGVVVYSGDGLVGYGELVIIKHNDSFLSAYGHNRERLVTEGQHVKAGQEIAKMGSSGTSRDELEFQIRKDGNPVDPLDYLPKR